MTALGDLMDMTLDDLQFLHIPYQGHHDLELDRNTGFLLQLTRRFQNRLDLHVVDLRRGDP
jgi:hypothetical protein